MRSPSINHAEIQLLLADYRDLRGAERHEVESHVQGCPSCAARLAEFQAMDIELQGLRDGRPGPGLRAGYYAAVKAQPSSPVAGRAPAWRPSRFYGFASIAAVIVLVVAVWSILRPGSGSGHPRTQGATPAAKSAEVGSFIWQTDGVYGYEMLRPAGWSIADSGGGLRSYGSPVTNGNALELQVANLKAVSDYMDGAGGLREMRARFDAKPNLGEWSKSVEEMWLKYGPTFERVSEVPNATIYAQRFDTTSRVQGLFVALVVREGQPLVVALHPGDQGTTVEILKSNGIWDDFLTMMGSMRPIPRDVNNVQPWASSAQPAVVLTVLVTRAPTAEPVVMPTAATTPNPRLVFHPDRDVIEQELSRAVLGAQVANRVCDWLVLGAQGRSFYVWTYCAAYLNAPDITAASMPAVLTFSDDGTGVTVRTPRDGTYYPEDVRSLFPPAIQQQIFDRSFDPALTQRQQHAKLRLKWSGLPPVGANEIAPVDPNQPTAGAAVSIFSGRPDPAWTLTYRELEELDRLLLPLSTGQCPSLPDQLGYRGVRVSLGMEPSGTLVAADGFVQSGDTGTTSDAICLRDPERTVERFLLSSAQANVSEDLKPVVGQLLQPVPTPLVTPSPALTMPEGWTGYGDETLDIQFVHPEKWEAGTKTAWSRVYQTKAAEPGENPVEPPPFWFTVLPPGFKNEDASAYNWWSDEEVAAAWKTHVGESLVGSHATEGYNNYTRLADTTVNGFPAAVVNNLTVWEMPKAVQERRVLVKVGGLTVMFGTYYKTEDDLQAFEEVLASVKFGSLLTARGAASTVPQPDPSTPTPTGGERH